jgi:hypothetical protein
MDIMRSQVNMTWIKMPHRHITPFFYKKILQVMKSQIIIFHGMP